MSDIFDVIIVGAGPAGSACATLLARHNIHVLLLDKAKFPREKICGDCINPKSWKFFELLGVADALRASNLHMIDALRIATPDGSALAQPITKDVYHPFFSLRRSDLDNLLLRRARQAGAAVAEESTVINIRRTKRWEIDVRGKGGEINRVHSTILIGADGRNSIVAKSLCSKPTRQRGGFRHDDRIGIQWHTEYQPRIGSCVQMFLFDSGYGGVVNVGSDCANVALVTHAKIASLAKHNIQLFLQKTIFSNSAARKQFDSLKPVEKLTVAYPITPMTRYSPHPDVYLIGDARQTVEPFTGEGVFFALQDAYRAALKILYRFQRDTSTNLIPSHSTFWVNSAFSPALRHRKIALSFITLGRRVPRLVPFVMKTVFE